MLNLLTTYYLYFVFLYTWFIIIIVPTIYAIYDRANISEKSKDEYFDKYILNMGKK